MKKEKSVIKMGVWLDHATAFILKFDDGEAAIMEFIDSPYDRRVRIDGEGSDTARFGPDHHSASSNEDRKHNIKENELDRYFDLLEERLQEADDILLFGPTNTKEQLHNRMEDNKHFKDKTITVKATERLTDHQMIAYVREFFQ